MRSQVRFSFSPEALRSLAPEMLALLFPSGFGPGALVEFEREVVDGVETIRRERTARPEEFAAFTPEQKRALSAGDRRAVARMTPHLRRVK